jgi:zinc transport system substrate-binding protein
MPKIESTFKGLTVVDTREGIKLRKMGPADRHTRETENAEHHGNELSEHHDSEHSGGEGHRHEAGAADPHIWLDPLLVKIQAQTICDGLSTIDPRHADAYRKNLGTFRQDLDRVDALITKALEPLKGREIFVFHPAYGYFADRYHLRQAAVEIGGKEPSARQLSVLIGKAKEAGVRVIFVQPQFDRKNAQTIASAIGGAVVSLDPLAPDYIRNLEEMAAKVKSALSK